MEQSVAASGNLVSGIHGDLFFAQAERLVLVDIVEMLDQGPCAYFGGLGEFGYIVGASIMGKPCFTCHKGYASTRRLARLWQHDKTREGEKEASRSPCDRNVSRHALSIIVNGPVRLLMAVARFLDRTTSSNILHAAIRAQSTMSILVRREPGQGLLGYVLSLLINVGEQMPPYSQLFV